MLNQVLAQMLNLAKPLAVVVLAAVLSIFHEGCKPAQAPLDGPYTAETEYCVIHAKSRSESHLCRANVNQRYGLCPSAVLPCPGDLK